MQNSQTPQVPSTTAVGDTRPQKPSIRAADQYDICANREADLEDGPLLLNMGEALRSFEIDDVHYIEQTDNEARDTGHLSSAGLPSAASPELCLPYSHELATAAYTETATQSGPSQGTYFSSLGSNSASIPAAARSNFSRANNFALDTAGMGAFASTFEPHYTDLLESLVAHLRPESERNASPPSTDDLDFDIPEGLRVGRGSDTRAKPLFSWEVEFSWNDQGQSTFNDEPLRRYAATDSIRPLSDDSEEDTLSQEPLEDWPDQIWEEFQEPRGDWPDQIWEDFQENVIAIVNDHFWRTRGSRKPGERTGGQPQNERPNRTSRHQSSSYKVSKPRSSGKKGTRGGDSSGEGSGESDHEGPEDKNQHAPRKSRPPVTCPFYKNDPRDFQQCATVKCGSVGYLTLHLNTKHNEQHCETCFQTMDAEMERNHHCYGYSRPRKIKFLSYAALGFINTKARPKQGLVKDWESIYKVIFPDDPNPLPSPFQEPSVSVLIKDFQNYLRLYHDEHFRLAAQSCPLGQAGYSQQMCWNFDQAKERWLAQAVNDYLVLGQSDAAAMEAPSSSSVVYEVTSVPEESAHSMDGMNVGQTDQSTGMWPSSFEDVPLPNFCTLPVVDSQPNLGPSWEETSQQSYVGGDSTQMGAAFANVSSTQETSNSQLLFNDWNTNEMFGLWGNPIAMDSHLSHPMSLDILSDAATGTLGWPKLFGDLSSIENAAADHDIAKRINTSGRKAEVLSTLTYVQGLPSIAPLTPRADSGASSPKLQRLIHQQFAIYIPDVITIHGLYSSAAPFRLSFNVAPITFVASPIYMAADLKQKQGEASQNKNYKGFVSGVFSGIAKLSVGHPFDTIKVRLQTTDASRFSGPLQCVAQTLRHEGVRGLYKGATPPLVGWMFMDSVMLGSLTVYRRLLAENVFTPNPPPPSSPHTDPLAADGQQPIAGASHAVAHLPSYGHGIAGVMAGATVSFVAAPVEHIKARLQIQYSAHKHERLYTGPVDCLKKIYGAHGLRGVYKGLYATLLFRSFFFFWWGSYDVFSRLLRDRTSLSAPAINFWAGGLSAQVFWITSYPSDVIKQRIMTDPMGGKLNDGTPQFKRWSDAARTVYRETGWKGYWRGFLPCFLRAFPANAAALVAFEGVMRHLP